MHKQAPSRTSRSHHLEALCALSDSPTPFTPNTIKDLIKESPDPETAARTLLGQLSPESTALARKWRQLVIDMWSAQHPNIPVLTDLPLAANDVHDVTVVQDALAFLDIVSHRPPAIVKEQSEWLIDPQDSYFIASQLPHLKKNLISPLETEWHLLPLRRLRETLQALRLVRRYSNKLIVVKSRYERFLGLPTIQQFYLLWHTEAYHIDWGQFSGLWEEYLRALQEFLPTLWEISYEAEANVPYSLRQWNQEIWDTFLPIWEQAGLLDKKHNETTLLASFRLHSLPTAITQVIMKDLFERYGLVCGEGEVFVWSDLGIKIIEAERDQKLPCSLDII